MKYSRLLKISLILAVFVAIGAIYIHHLSLDVYAGDNGDFITASYVFGIPHPPGYPLFTFLGFLLTRLPISTPAFRVGLISVIASVGSLVLLYRFSFRISKSILISLLSVSILAFSYLFWFYSEIAEVFALNTFFALLLFYLAILFYEEKKIQHFYLLAFFSGLSLSHHHTIVLIFPSLFYLLIRHKKLLLKKKKQIFIAGGLFVIGLLPYVYIPIAASHNPPVNWMGTPTVNNFVDIVTRKVYGTFNAGKFTPLPTFQRIFYLKNYVIKVLASLTIPGLLVVCVGVLQAFRIHRRLSISLLTAILISGLLFNFYAGFRVADKFALATVERFYVLSFVLFILFLPFGFIAIKRILGRIFSKKLYIQAVLLGFFLFPVMLFRVNTSRTDFSHMTMGQGSAADIFSSIEKNAALIVSGDSVIFNTWYSYYVLHVRNDIGIINPIITAGKFVGNNFYYEKERKMYNQTHNKQADDSKINGIIIREIYKKRPMYAISPFDDDELKNMDWVPVGLTFRLYDEKEKESLSKEAYLHLVSSNLSKIHTFPKNLDNKLFLYDMRVFYADSYSKIGTYLQYHYNDMKLAADFFRKAVEIDDHHSYAYTLLSVIDINYYKSCKRAFDDINNAIRYDPNTKINYMYLYEITQTCSKKNKIFLEGLKAAYRQSFKSNIESDVKEFLEESKDSQKK